MKLTHQTRRETIVYIKVLAPLLFILAITLHFHKFVVEAVEANLAINLGIIGASLYGVILILLRLRHAQRDFRIIERFGQEARAGVPMKELLDRPWLNGVYVRHYLNHIANTGGTLNSQMDQNAIENELHALQDEYNSRLELPQFIVGFMIAMGLLGTFIGLLETLTGISGMLDGMGAPGVDVQKQFSKLVVELRKPLAGMGIAFSASMFGLVTSLMLAVMMTNLRRYVSRVMALARNVMHDLIVITSTASPAQQVQRTGGGNMSSISNTTLAGRFEVLTQKMEAVINTIETSIGATQRMVDMLGFGPRMRELSEKTLEEMKNLSNRTADQQRLLETLIESGVERNRAGRDLLEFQAQAKETNNELLQTIKSLAGSDVFFSQRRDQEFRDRLLSELKNFNTLQTDSKKLSQSLIEVNDNGWRGVNMLVQAQREARNELSSFIGGLVEGLQKVEEVNIGGARHLYDIKERLIKLGNNMEVVNAIANGIGGQTALLETLVGEVRISNSGQTEETDFPQEPEEDIYL